jgi:hypothetical protein
MKGLLFSFLLLLFVGAELVSALLFAPQGQQESSRG